MIVLGGIAYGVYVVLNKGARTEPPPGISKDWARPVDIQGGTPSNNAGSVTLVPQGTGLAHRLRYPPRRHLARRQRCPRLLVAASPNGIQRQSGGESISDDAIDGRFESAAFHHGFADDDQPGRRSCASSAAASPGAITSPARRLPGPARTQTLRWGPQPRQIRRQHEIQIPSAAWRPIMTAQRRSPRCPAMARQRLRISRIPPQWNSSSRF